jgi:paraquat-inducible protein A
MDTQDNTIMSGVIYFWSSSEWPLAVIVFVASIDLGRRGVVKLR